MTAALEERIHNEQTQRLDARRIAKLYDVHLIDIAKAIGANPDALRKRPDGRPVQDRLAVLVDCFARLYDVMARDEKAVRRWLNRPNPGLDGARPLALMEQGRLTELQATIAQMETASFA